MQLANFINGQYLPDSSAKFIPVTTPHDGTVIAQVPLSSPQQIEQAIQSAHEAFLQWSQQTIKQRTRILFKYLELSQQPQHLNELVDLIVKEHGKTKQESLAEIMKGNETLEYATGLQQLAPGRIMEVSRGVQCRDERCPLGVVCSIVPFNFPYMVPFWTICHAIVLGNAIIVKPSEKVPLTMNKVAALWKEAGLPVGVFSLLHGQAEVVQKICAHPLVKAVTFVGTSHVAELISHQCRQLNKRVLALGGAKNHLVAAPDCHLEMTSQDVVNSFTGCSGQRCMAASVLLTIGEQKELVQNIIEKASKLQAGSDTGCIGPVIDQISKDKILRYINEAEKNPKNKILLDGRSWSQKTGFWVGPTIIQVSDVNDPTMRDEIFGPVLTIYVCKNAEEAVQIENGNPYGNAACIYTETGKIAEWFTNRFSAGMLGVNIGVPVPREPFSFGGINKSKFGDFDITGDGGMEFFTYRKKITTKWSKPEQQTWLS